MIFSKKGIEEIEKIIDRKKSEDFIINSVASKLPHLNTSLDKKYKGEIGMMFGKRLIITIKE